MKLSGDDYRALVSGERRGWRSALVRGGLRALSLPYGVAVRLRNRLYDRGWLSRRRPAIPVVSVGNLTLGGTGKTPCVEYIAQHYRRSDWRVAILSRGYGAVDGPNDEALVLEENLPDVPHLQGADRATLADIAVRELESEVLVLDDGFQHRQLARDLDVVLIDGTQPWGHGYLFPRGLLREPRSSLRRADAVLLTRCDQVDKKTRNGLQAELARWAPKTLVAQTSHQPMYWLNSERHTQPVDELAGRPVAAFCGIGNPEAFRRTLSAVGAEVVEFRTFGDHHRYSRTDVDDLRDWARSPRAEAVVTTQKDLVKIRLAQLGGKDVWALRIGLQFETGQEKFERLLDRVMTRAERD